MTRSIAKIFLCCLVAALVSGCMEADTTVFVKADGSGTLTQEIFFGAGMMQMMGGMMGGQPGAAQGTTSIPIDPEEFKAKAPSLGEGVTFLKAEEVNANGKSGIRILYTFTDIRKLKVSESPDMPGAMGGMMGGQGQKASTLIVKMPQPEKKVDPTIEIPDSPDLPPEQMAMMKQMFDGFRIRLIVKVNGEIKKTNASHVSKGKSGKRNQVTLMDMDMGKIMSDEKYMKKLSSMGNSQDMAKAKELMKDIPGLKFETEEFVKISF
jgi:hypothetical protein